MVQLPVRSDRNDESDHTDRSSPAESAQVSASTPSTDIESLGPDPSSANDQPQRRRIRAIRSPSAPQTQAPTISEFLTQLKSIPGAPYVHPRVLTYRND